MQTSKLPKNSGIYKISFPNGDFYIGSAVLKGRRLSLKNYQIKYWTKMYKNNIGIYSHKKANYE